MEYVSGTAHEPRYREGMPSHPGGPPTPRTSMARSAGRPGSARPGSEASRGGTYRAGTASPGRTYGGGSVVRPRDDRAAGSRPGGSGRGNGPGGPGGGKGKGKGRGPRRRSPIWARLLVVFGALLMLASGLTVGAYKYVLAQANNALDQQNLLGSAGQDRAHATIKGAKNLLLVGIDPRPDQAATDLIRSDSIMILHIPASHDRAFLISVPRDSYVQIPAYNNGAKKYAGGHNKINSAFAFGAQGLTGKDARIHGMQLLAATIKNVLGINLDGGAIVDFEGFTDIVKYLGTIHMYVDEKVTSIHIGFDKNGKETKPYYQDKSLHLHKIAGVTPQVYTKGWHDFTSWQALDYCRQRDLLENGDGDYGRQRHQQQFVKAVFQAVMKRGMTSPTQLPSLLKAVGKAMIIDNGGISLEDWIFAMKGISANDLMTIKTNGGKFNSQSVPGIGSVELISDTSMDLFKAVANDTVDVFANEHPDWISQSS